MRSCVGFTMATDWGEDDDQRADPLGLVPALVFRALIELGQSPVPRAESIRTAIERRHG